MAFVFREIGNLASWETEANETWLERGDVKADALKHLRTTNCTLSIFLIDERDLAERVATAFAANRQKVEAVKYTVFEASLLEANGLSISRIAGQVPDEEVAGWHADIVQLSGAKLVTLARLILANGERTKVIPTKVGRLINQARLDQRIGDSGLEPKLIDELKQTKFAVT